MKIMSTDYSSYLGELNYEYSSAVISSVIVTIFYFVSITLLIYYFVKEERKVWVLLMLGCFTLLLYLQGKDWVDIYNDISHVRNRHYLVGKGTATTKSDDLEFSSRKIRIELSHGETISISFKYGPVYKGDRFEFIYLPHTRIAVIIRKLKDDE